MLNSSPAPCSGGCDWGARLGSIKIDLISLPAKAFGWLLLRILNQYVSANPSRNCRLVQRYSGMQSNLEMRILNLKIMCHWAFVGMSFSNMGNVSRCVVSRLRESLHSFFKLMSLARCKISGRSFRTKSLENLSLGPTKPTGFSGITAHRTSNKHFLHLCPLVHTACF